MTDEPKIETQFYAPGDDAIPAAKDQIQAEALDIVREAHSVFLVAITGETEDGKLVTKTIAYGSPVLLPAAVHQEASTYLTDAVAELIEQAQAGEGE